MVVIELPIETATNNTKLGKGIQFQLRLLESQLSLIELHCPSES